MSQVPRYLRWSPNRRTCCGHSTSHDCSSRTNALGPLQSVSCGSTLQTGRYRVPRNVSAECRATAGPNRRFGAGQETEVGWAESVRPLHWGDPQVESVSNGWRQIPMKTCGVGPGQKTPSRPRWRRP